MSWESNETAGWGAAAGSGDTSWGGGETSTDAWGTGGGGTTETSAYGNSAGGRGGGGGGSGCRNCGEDGHFARECPTATKKSNACFKCNEEGHISRECPNASASRGCRKCGEEGHIARECPTAPADSGGDRPCFNCGLTGHRKSDCPEPLKERPPMKCYNCQQEGHSAKDCTSEQVLKMGEDGKPLPPIYRPEEPTITESTLAERITKGINFDKYDNIPVDMSDKSFNPCESFNAANLCGVLNKCIQCMGFTKPTPIQRYALPVLFAGKDLMACAQTGSGKTGAFLIPIIQNLLTDPDLPNLKNEFCQTPLAVILAPTRELASQIHKEARMFCLDGPTSALGINVVYGGTATDIQRSRVLSGSHIIVGTCGRLKDFVDRKIISFEKVKFLVFDEADRMLDMGFEPEVRYFAEHVSMPKKEARQTLMFSATFPPEVQILARKYLRNDCVKVTVGILGGVNQDVSQSFIEVPGNKKRDTLIGILDDIPSCKTAYESATPNSTKDQIIVFVETQKSADFLAVVLAQKGFSVTSMHGARTQQQRESSLYDFKNGRYSILVATAVAARGLDITGVTLVINYDLPREIDGYVHRVGRTGRVGNPGKATAFFDPDKNSELAVALVKVLNECQQPVPDFISASASGGSFSAMGGADGGDWNGGAAQEEECWG